MKKIFNISSRPLSRVRHILKMNKFRNHILPALQTLRNYTILEKKNLNSLMMDGNEAAARIAYNLCDSMFIYPITPSSPMAEACDNWRLAGKTNVFGQVVDIVQLQSEAGACAALQGSLQSGGLSTTFTSSQGLLLMLPNLYQISAQLLPGVIHVAARSIAGTGTSIGGDHSDVMGVRASGIGMISSHCPQESHDLALIAHIASLKTRIPFIHFFDGMQVSHQINNVEIIDKEIIKKLLPKEAVYEHQRRSLNPIHPHRQGSSVSNDIYFQMTEAMNPYYKVVPDVLEETMNEFAKETGRNYQLFDYAGVPDAEYVVVIMGAGSLTTEEVVKYLNEKDGEKYGVIKVRCYRPWSAKHFLKALPKSVKKIAVLDRVKEASSSGEPLYMDVCSTLMDNSIHSIPVIGGRYGIAGKAFTPAMVKAVFDNLKLNEPKKKFTVGINDDVSHTSLPIGPNFSPIPNSTKQCIFFALGSDGTVGANKNAIKIIGDNTDLYAQGYFFYSAHKSGSATVSHLRFGPNKIISQYPITIADYIACHNKAYIHQFNVLKAIKEEGTFVLNSPWTTIEQLEKALPNRIKKIIAQRNIKFYNIDANQIAKDLNMPGRINMIMQTVFFKLADLFPEEEAIGLLKRAIEKAYHAKGKTVIDQNKASVDVALENLIKINYPQSWKDLPDDPIKQDSVPEFVKNIQQAMIRREGDLIPVSAFPVDGRTPAGTAYYEKRGITEMVPTWIPEKCTQCNICSFVCPHSAIRPFILNEDEVNKAPEAFRTIKMRGNKENSYTIQVSPLDCTGCTACTICPSKALKMVPVQDVLEKSKEGWNYGLSLKNKEYKEDTITVKGSQFKEPLFEFSGACAGCGQTPYMKLLTQLYGPRMMIANATGCSSVWGSYYPSNPFTVNRDNRGPAYARSLFESNGEFGLGMLTAQTQRRKYLAQLITEALNDSTVSMSIPLRSLFTEWIENMEDALKCEKLYEQIETLLKRESVTHSKLAQIYQYNDLFIKPSQWIIGGDGWAYDIGFGGLDHVLAQGKNLNVLVFDNEEYANTGGQMSKATPISAVTKFAAGGKRTQRKDLGLIAMTYENIYVASIALGASYNQTVKAIVEAESYDGPSLILAYCPCVDHAILDGMGLPGLKDAKEAVRTGYWPLYRYDPRLKKEGKNPFQLDSPLVRTPVSEFTKREGRYTQLKEKVPHLAENLESQLEDFVAQRFEKLKRYAGLVESPKYKK